MSACASESPRKYRVLGAIDEGWRLSHFETAGSKRDFPWAPRQRTAGNGHVSQRHLDLIAFHLKSPMSQEFRGARRYAESHRRATATGRRSLPAKGHSQAHSAGAEGLPRRDFVLKAVFALQLNKREIKRALALLEAKRKEERLRGQTQRPR